MPSTMRAASPSSSDPEFMELAGRLDSGSAATVADDVRLGIQSGVRRMVLDCANLHYISGAGLRVVLALAREMQMAQGKLSVCNLQAQVKEMFDACGLAAVIPDLGTKD